VLARRPAPARARPRPGSARVRRVIAGTPAFAVVIVMTAGTAIVFTPLIIAIGVSAVLSGRRRGRGAGF
jgi:hypothetical protein